MNCAGILRNLDNVNRNLDKIINTNLLGTMWDAKLLTKMGQLLTFQVLLEKEEQYPVYCVSKFE